MLRRWLVVLVCGLDWAPGTIGTDLYPEDIYKALPPLSSAEPGPDPYDDDCSTSSTPLFTHCRQEWQDRTTLHEFASKNLANTTLLSLRISKLLLVVNLASF